MTNSQPDSVSGIRLDRLLALLDEGHLLRTIDGPLDRAAATFFCQVPKASPHRVFHQILGECVRHLYQKGLVLPRMLSPDQAAGEAIFLLDTFYQSPTGRGYDVAYLDARQNPPEGIEAVLGELVGILKARQRQNHIRWVCVREFQDLAWPDRCRLVVEFFRRYGDLLSADLRCCPLEQLADELPDLIQIYLGSCQLCHRALGTGSAGRAAETNAQGDPLSLMKRQHDPSELHSPPMGMKPE